MMIKRFLLMFGVVVLSLPFYSQQEILIEESLVMNIEVPVRVFRGNEFMDNLSIKDFEVFENGVRQKIEAVYFIRKDVVQRKDEKKKFSPETERTFFLFFEVTEYDPRLGKAMEYFVSDVLLPNDNLIAITPLKTYRLKDRGLEIKPKPKVVEELRGLIRKDTIKGGSEYKTALKDIEEIARSLSASASGDTATATPIEMERADGLLHRYGAALQKLETMRKVDQMKLLDFAAYLKNRSGQKYVFIFYQREFIPVLENSILEHFRGYFNDNVSATFSLSEYFDFFRRDATIDIDKVKKRFADAATSIHFLFLSRPSEHIHGVRFEAHSEDIFAPFLEIAKASGGFVESSANPDFLFKKAVAASENYYLLYYAPKEYSADGKFKEIEVRVRKPGYKIIHRLGYFAD